MPFIQPMGVSTKSRGCNTGISFNVPEQKQAEAERSYQVKNSWVKSADDTGHIFTKTWQLVGASAQSVVIFVHDVLEHCERYHSLFAYFACKGIEVQSFDLPGFGETGARNDSQGNTGGYDALLKEIDSAIDRASATHLSRSIFLMGHGMGGALVLNYVCGLGKRITSLTGVISSSPYLKPTLLSAGARFPSTYNRLGKWYPNVGVGFQITPEELTRDLGEQDRYHSDGLIQISVSLQCLGDMIYQGNKMMTKRWKKFPTPLPILLLHGTEDPICSYRSTAILSTQLRKLQPINFVFKSWKGSKHDPHWDLDAASVRSEYVHWICNTSRRFSKLPLEPSMVHSDNIKSARAKEKARSIKDEITITSEVRDKKEKKLPKVKKDKGQGTTHSSANINSSTAPTVSTETGADSAANGNSKAPESPEPIDDLMGLLRQQQQKLEKAKEKRREYGLGEDGTKASDELQQLGETSPPAAAPTNGGNVDDNGVTPRIESGSASAGPVVDAGVKEDEQKDAEQKVADIENDGTEDTATHDPTEPTAEKADSNLDAPPTEPNVETALPETCAEIVADSTPTTALDASLPDPIVTTTALANGISSEPEPLEETNELDAETKPIALESESNADAASVEGERESVAIIPEATEPDPKLTAKVNPGEALLHVEDEISEASGSTTPQKDSQEVETPGTAEHATIDLEVVEQVAPA